jgi:hypothetical protein
MRLPRIITLLSVIVFAVSLTQKCFSSTDGKPGAWSPGLYLLLIGVLGVLEGIFEWLANPVLVAAWVFSFAGKNKIALLLGIVASALMAGFLLGHTFTAGEYHEKIIGYSAGYWLWQTSGALMIVSGATGLLRTKIEAKPGGYP